MIYGCSITAFGLLASAILLVRSKDPCAIYGMMQNFVWECSFTHLPEVVLQLSSISNYQHLKYSLQEESGQVDAHVLVFFTSVSCAPVAQTDVSVTPIGTITTFVVYDMCSIHF